ncbi:hypothetical protein GCM10022224_082200 [Nonomuraea antimicrobica]|uniref:cAMP-binding domain of CRP or a regulatory subunit of cAMP-dependent protein kinases n=1 Tax=Nonomuraea antimicrobica TaxID=561173 RepID=A0ABP7DGT3_9ACTN
MPLLAGLPDERLRVLWEVSRPGEHPVGQVLCRAGDPATYLVLLLRGRVSATATTRAGRVVRHGEWDGPCALDKVALIDGGAHPATLTAVTPCAVRNLRRDRFLGLVDDAASVRRHVLRVLAGQARASQERFVAAATLPAEARLASWLLGEAAEHGVVTLPGGQEELAALLGVTRVTLNRALSRLRRDGLLTVTRGTVTLLAPELLERRAHG